MTKQCTKCKRILARSEFHKNKTHKDGLHYYCKECIHKDRIDLKLEAINAFGGRCIHINNGIQCPKNITDNPEEMELSHPNGDGDAHRDLISKGRKGYYFYRALQKIGYDTGKFVVQVMCRFHHRSFDNSGKKHPRYGKYGKSNPLYKQGKFNNPSWLKKKYETMILQEIADLCGVSTSTIYSRMVEFGYSRRKPGQSP
jgi:hypothetical protein